MIGLVARLVFAACIAIVGILLEVVIERVERRLERDAWRVPFRERV